MPDAILPALGILVRCFVCILDEPIVDIAEDHGVSRCLQEGFVNKLCIRLFLVDGAVVVAVTPGLSAKAVKFIIRSRRASGSHRAIGGAVRGVIGLNFQIADPLGLVIGIELVREAAVVPVRVIEAIWRLVNVC
jgi:hypothetical protein